MSFQALLNGANGQPLPNGSYNLSLRFWDGTGPGATPVSTNILLTNVLVSSGVASASLPVDSGWFNGQTRYLEVTVNDGGELLLRIVITAVPYACAAGNIYPDPKEGDPRIVGTLRTSNGVWVENAPLGSFSYVGRFAQGYYLNWNGTTRQADFYRLIGEGDRSTGYGVAIGEDIASPVLWMSHQVGNAFKVVSVDPEKQVRDENELFSVSFNGIAACRVLQITGGADLAANLTVHQPASQHQFRAEPGMVISIDPTGNRKFKLSAEPYAQKRVGTISGGNAVKPGLLLRGAGNPQAYGDQPIALTGQVWCRADASFGPITPGDLLTTSTTPGHAMRVSDFDMARFAVPGQALTGLKEGRGWVQALVGKQ